MSRRLRGSRLDADPAEVAARHARELEELAPILDRLEELAHPIVAILDLDQHGGMAAFGPLAEDRGRLLSALAHAYVSTAQASGLSTDKLVDVIRGLATGNVEDPEARARRLLREHRQSPHGRRRPR